MKQTYAFGFIWFKGLEQSVFIVGRNIKISSHTEPLVRDISVSHNHEYGSYILITGHIQKHTTPLVGFHPYYKKFS